MLVRRVALERAWPVHAREAHSLIQSFLHSHFISTTLFAVRRSVDTFQGNGTRAPQRGFSPHFYSLLFFLKSSSWKYLAKTGEKKKWTKKKNKNQDFEERKTTSSWATHTPSAVVLSSSFIICTFCALIWFPQLGVLLVRVVVFFLQFSGTKQQGRGSGGRRFSPVCI